MADEIDLAQGRELLATTFAVNQVRERASRIKPGEPGICERCEEFSGRLVEKTCAPCRDKYKLP